MKGNLQKDHEIFNLLISQQKIFEGGKKGLSSRFPGAHCFFQAIIEMFVEVLSFNSLHRQIGVGN